MHYDGEADIRGAYCALSVAKLTDTFNPEIFNGTAKWIQRCQTWEGGFGGCPGMEAHGGYALCGLASLVLLGKTDLCNLTSLIVSILLISNNIILTTTLFLFRNIQRVISTSSCIPKKCYSTFYITLHTRFTIKPLKTEI